MKTLNLFLLLCAASLAVMVGVDAALGAKAEFLNAYSVLLRALGTAPAAGDSLVARELGVFGEFVVVVLASLASGGALTAIVRAIQARRRCRRRDAMR